MSTTLQQYADLLGLSAPKGFEDWVIWGAHDRLCANCNSPSFLIAQSPESSDVGRIGSICGGLLHPARSDNFSVLEMALIQDRATYNLDQNGSLGANFTPVISSIEVKVDSHTAASNAYDVAIPNGYKSVGWIKLVEAEAIIRCIVNKETVTVTSAKGIPTFTATYFAEGSPEHLKFGSTCEAKRLRSGWTKWVRRHEAEAVLESNRSRKDITTVESASQSGCIVQYFPPESPQAQKFFSSFRLLRTR